MPDTTKEPATLLPGYARIHYYRPDGDYANWDVYSWQSSAEPNDYNAGPEPVTSMDAYGAYFDIQLISAPTDLNFIIHNVTTGTKDPGADMHLLAVAQHLEAWVISGDATVYTSQPGPAQILASGFGKLQAFWIDRRTVAIQRQYQQPGWSYSLAYSPDANLQITSAGMLANAQTLPLTPAAFTGSQLQQYPQLAGYAVYQLDANVPVATLAQVVKSQITLAATEASGALKYLTGVQSAGALDDLFYYAGPLGASFEHGVHIRVWAPTAQSVNLLLYNNASGTNPSNIIPMNAMNGVWTATGESSWRDKYYLFSVNVYVPSLHRIVTNVVTDPYSTDLALNGVKTRLTDLRSERTMPVDWEASGAPPLRSKRDFSMYELHVRDFSVADASVPTEQRGTYLAFSDPESNGMRHLRQLAKAGLTAVHLLPTFHFGSVNEDKTTWEDPGDLSGYPPDSTEQQMKVSAVKATDGYNWGYDPVHYLAPEGSYAVDPDERVKEYRQMVKGLHGAGLRVVQDVVFNHTTSSGQAPNSVLDEIVPNYYYRLDADGNVENGTCCSDTASEHKMMEKLMMDALVHNAREYKIDGFRFDLMSFHFVYNLEHIQEALGNLTPEKDGVDGSKIYLYGEGWNFGETGSNQLGPNASQANMYGTGIGTFNDRVRDAIRGGGPFSDRREQGFATGLFTDSSLYTDGEKPPEAARSQLLDESDWIRAALAGNMRDFTFTDRNGNVVPASQLNYGGQPVGYTASPIESVNYCSVHDNQILFDAIQLKSALPGTTSGGGDTIAMRARRQVLALSLIALGQAVPFFHGGDDLLRSKDMDNNSYDSGDWFNKIDWTYQSANWGIGLPLASDNQSQWPMMQPLLTNPALMPTPANIASTRDAFQDFLRIRSSSLLFRLETLQEVQNSLHFLNTGPNQMPGLLVMKLDANGANYGRYEHVVVAFNATPGTVRLQDDGLKGLQLRLHPVQAGGHDSIVQTSMLDDQTGTMEVPGLTTAVFVSEQ